MGQNCLCSNQTVIAIYQQYVLQIKTYSRNRKQSIDKLIMTYQKAEFACHTLLEVSFRLGNDSINDSSLG